MHKLVEIGDLTSYYELTLPCQPSDTNVISKDKNIKSLNKTEYGKLIFAIATNHRYGYFEGEPHYKLVFSHFEVSK